MPQSLNTIQKKHVNETVRPAIEDLVRFWDRLDKLIREMDNQQDPIIANAEVLNDGDGDAPRTDAPQLTGNDVANLRTFAAAMRDQIGDTALNTLIEKMVRDLSAVTGER